MKLAYFQVRTISMWCIYYRNYYFLTIYNFIVIKKTTLRLAKIKHKKCTPSCYILALSVCPKIWSITNNRTCSWLERWSALYAPFVPWTWLEMSNIGHVSKPGLSNILKIIHAFGLKQVFEFRVSKCRPWVLWANWRVRATKYALAFLCTEEFHQYIKKETRRD